MFRLFLFVIFFVYIFSNPVLCGECSEENRQLKKKIIELELKIIELENSNRNLKDEINRIIKIERDK